jgi:hypothetical protein
LGDDITELVRKRNSLIFQALNAAKQSPCVLIIGLRIPLAARLIVCVHSVSQLATISDYFSSKSNVNGRKSVQTHEEEMSAESDNRFEYFFTENKSRRGHHRFGRSVKSV